MSSYIDGLAAKALGISQSILPRVPALFEPIRAMPGLLDVRTAKLEDMPVEIASSADDINQPLAKDSIRGLASENSLDIKSSFKSAIDPTKKAPAQTANSGNEGHDRLENTPIKRQDVLGHANPGSSQDQMVHFEQASGPVRADQVRSDIEASQPNPGQAPNRNIDRNINWKSQKIKDIAVEEAAEEATEDTGTIEPVVKGTITEGTATEATVIDGMPSFKHGERRADIIPNKVSEETVIRPLDRESDESSVIKNTPNGVPKSLGYANLESFPNQSISFDPDSRFSRVSQVSSDTETVHSGKDPSRSSKGIDNKPIKEAIEETTEETTKEIIEEATGDNKVYEHTNMGNELSNMPSPELDQKQTIAGSKSSDITLIKPLIEGTLADAPVFKSSKMSVDKSQITQPLTQNNASQSPETIGQPVIGQPVIKVTIGRIEVKAVLPPDKKAQRQAPKAKSNSLEKYLLSIRGGSK